MEFLPGWRVETLHHARKLVAISGARNKSGEQSGASSLVSSPLDALKASAEATMVRQETQRSCIEYLNSLTEEFDTRQSLLIVLLSIWFSLLCFSSTTNKTNVNNFLM